MSINANFVKIMKPAFGTMLPACKITAMTDDKTINIAPVAYFRSHFPSKFGVPRQSGVVAELPGEIVFVPEFRRGEALKGIEEFSHLWLVWGFSGNVGRWQMTVRPPRLGGNKSVGVFASRSPFRPNGLGLSSVALDKVDWDAPDGPVLKVLGADLMDGTPIYDIKPYIRYSDSHPDARSGYTDNVEWEEAEVIFPEHLKEKFQALGRASEEDVSVLKKVLAQKPVPRYQHDPEKVYGMPYKGCDIRFRVSGGTVEVVDVVGDPRSSRG